MKLSAIFLNVLIVYGFSTDQIIFKIFFEKIFEKNLSLISFKNFYFKDFSGVMIEIYVINVCFLYNRNSIEIVKFFKVVCFWSHENSTLHGIL